MQETCTCVQAIWTKKREGGSGKVKIFTLTCGMYFDPLKSVLPLFPLFQEIFYKPKTQKAYLIFVIFFTRAKFLENKIYTEKTRKLRQNTQKIANFLRYYGKIHSKLPIFRFKSVKIYTGQKKFTRIYSWGS